MAHKDFQAHHDARRTRAHCVDFGFLWVPTNHQHKWRSLKEYGFNGGACDRISITENENETETETIPLPRPRLPYPRIDGLHQYTYRAFCDAVAFYIGEREFPDHLHVRYIITYLPLKQATSPPNQSTKPFAALQSLPYLTSGQKFTEF
ncbi:hypothetical protein IFM89_027308 [Coptis chinensis]|uniref:Uncharacterized protein n=1 Tax=Coptis chinensis TaxID=261450 RepID=A0A835I714_9MAGN|nr:hypothetical protein IFM89_027308 [Coptis chinensis]